MAPPEDDSKSQEQQQPDAMAAISVQARLPQFWKVQPGLWFMQVESVLHSQKMSDEAKYHLVVAKLERDIILQVSDILAQPPANNKYTTLKTRLLEIYEESEAKKIKKLLNEMELGDQKPSQLLRQMKDLAKGRVTDDTLLYLWQNQLPTAVQAVLTVADKDMDVKATIADKVLEATTAGSGIAAIGKPSTSREADLVATVTKLMARIDALEGRGRPRERRPYDRKYRQGSRGPSNSRSQSRSGNGASTDKGRLCFYHFRFKQRATKCVQPCSWKADKQPEN